MLSKFLAVPPYTPGHVFAGRRRELQFLTEWATSLRNPLLVVEAIGGMGKSMLCWHWTKEVAPKVVPGTEGIFWYSFYERGADMSDFCSSALSFVHGRPVEDRKERRTSSLAAQLLPALDSKPWLFVLDGLERVLVAYNRYDAAQVRDEEVQSRRKAHECIHPADANLLRGLCEVRASKVLVSSRLMPTPLVDDLGRERCGVVHRILEGLDAEDAEAMLRTIGIYGSSKRMRRYLGRNFGCNPLIIGIVGGLVKRFIAAPDGFDRWVDHQGDENALSPEADVVRARHRILWAAFSDLSEDARTLLARIALVSESVDHETLANLNPRLPEPPAQVSPPDAWLLQYPDWVDEYNADKAAYDRYLAEFDHWRNSVAYVEAHAFLQETTRDLVDRGLLQADFSASRYDLHPVIRGYAVSSIPREEQDGVAQRVIDHFSSRTDLSPVQVTSVNDIRNALQVTRTLLHLGRMAQAAVSITDLNGALFWSLEAYSLYLSLARPLFRNGWGHPPFGVEGTDLAWLWNNTGLALSACGEHEEAISVQQLALDLFIDLDRTHGVLVSLRNLATKAVQVNNFADAWRIASLAAEATLILGDEEDMALAYIDLCEYSGAVGNFEAAESYWHKFDALPRPTTRDLYRPGHGEYILARIRWLQGALDHETLAHVERLAREGNSREFIRSLVWLRGEWRISRGEFEEASVNFEEHIKLTREVDLDPSWSEARLALAHLKLGRVHGLNELVSRLSAVKNPPYIVLAELHLALGDRDKAREQACAAYREAWGSGAPYTEWRAVEEARRVFDTLGDPEPCLSAFDPSTQRPLPFEQKLIAYLVKKTAENASRRAN